METDDESISSFNESSAQITDLNNLNYKNLSQLFGMERLDCSSHNSHVHYHYYSLDSLKAALNSSDVVQALSVIDDILDIICEYHGITMWSQELKSNKISVVDSNDNCIEYAILTNPDKTGNEEDEYHNIYCTQWIDASKGGVCRYAFKYLTFSDTVSFSIVQIGFVTASISSASTEHVGDDSDGNSMCWFANGAECGFSFKGDIITSNSDGNKRTQMPLAQWKLSRFISQRMDTHGNCYFMVELNFDENIMKAVCKAMKDCENSTVVCKIPDGLQEKLKNEPIRLAMTLRLHCRQTGSIGIGLIKTNI